MGVFNRFSDNTNVINRHIDLKQRKPFEYVVVKPFRDYGNMHKREIHMWADQIASHHDRSLFSDSDDMQDVQMGDGLVPEPELRRRTYFPRLLPPLDSRRGRGHSLVGRSFDPSGDQGTEAAGRYRKTIGGGGTRGAQETPAAVDDRGS